MKALMLDAPRKLRIVDVPIPEVPRDGVLIRVRSSSICGTDINIYNGNFEWPLPTRFGHEYSGEVAAVGSDVSNFAPGDRVVGENLIGCGHCSECKAGRYNLCDYVPQLFDTHAEYTVAPARSLYKFDAKVEWNVAALIEPLAVSYSATEHADVRAGCTVAILGDGGLGLSSLLMAKAKGAGKIIVSGLKPHKLELAKKLGADVMIDVNTANVVEAILDETGGKGADCTVVTVGWHHVTSRGTECRVILMEGREGKIASGGIA